MALIRIGHSPDPDDAFMFYALTAALLLRLFCGTPPTVVVEFDKIPHAVLDGRADLGLLIHEGQITYATLGLRKVLDLGQAWERETGLPLPLGVNVVRRALGVPMHQALSQALRDSIGWAHAHVDEALAYAIRYGRGIDKDTCRRFILIYVNDLTLSLGSEGRRALEELFGRAHRAGALAAI